MKKKKKKKPKRKERETLLRTEVEKGKVSGDILWKKKTQLGLEM